MLGVERCTAYFVDQRSNELVSWQGDINVKLPLGSGIAGTVGSTGTSIVIHDPYKDPRFNQEYDKKSGFTTRSILCVPIKTSSVVLGVLQLINKARPHTYHMYKHASIHTSTHAHMHMHTHKHTPRYGLSFTQERSRWPGGWVLYCGR
jgi:GAF domain-containing protein